MFLSIWLASIYLETREPGECAYISLKRGTLQIIWFFCLHQVISPFYVSHFFVNTAPEKFVMIGPWSSLVQRDFHFIAYLFSYYIFIFHNTQTLLIILLRKKRMNNQSCFQGVFYPGVYANTSTFEMYLKYAWQKKLFDKVSKRFLS